MSAADKYWNKRFKKELEEEKEKLHQEVDQAVKKKLAEIDEDSEAESN